MFFGCISCASEKFVDDAFVGMPRALKWPFYTVANMLAEGLS